MKRMRGLLTAVLGLAAMLQLAGCPQSGDLPPLEYVAGGTGDSASLGMVAVVDVLSPVSDLSIAGGTPVEVNWRAVGTTRFAVVDVIVDLDLDPDNNNEIVAEGNLDLTETTVLLDTTTLEAGDYFIGVVMREVDVIVAYDYAPGRVTVNQRPQLFFTSPRQNEVFDRTEALNPTFFVAWELSDPDSVVTVRIYLDPDGAANGNEILLRESNSQTGDSFTFDFPTAAFEPGTYRILALVSDGVDTFSFYAPPSIRLRSRLAGAIDLRDMHLPQSGIQGAVFEGFNPRDNAGSFVTSAQDIDGDGFGDMFFLAQFGKPDYLVNYQRTGVGEGYLVYGRRQRFSGVLNLNSTGTLFRGDIYGGVPEVPDPIRPSRGITSFAVMTDWDNDGVREFAFGIPFTDSAPSSYLEQGGYFRTGAVVIAAGSALGGFAGQNVFRLGDFGTVPIPANGTDTACPEGFYGPKAPTSASGSTLFHIHYGSIVSPARLGARLSTVGFGDQCGETVSVYPFYAGFT
ncbi:MAG: hypothetical protein KKB50_14110 [Planctomycetes bacterium]|nr:hypothetical protein [Planctomycetota bacterium]